MAGIYYRFRMTGMDKALNQLWPHVFLPTSRTVGTIMVNRIELRSEGLVKKVGKMMERDLKSATRTWNHKVDFYVKSRISAKSITVSIYSDDVVFGFVEKGTGVRHAVMTRNFVPKTAPGWLGSRKGSGGVAYISPNITRPGIEARNFYKTTASKHRKMFVGEMRKLIHDELRMVGLRK